MTFNIRFENEHDKNNAWQYRRELVVEIIKHHFPSSTRLRISQKAPRKPFLIA